MFVKMMQPLTIAALTVFRVGCSSSRRIGVGEKEERETTRGKEGVLMAVVVYVITDLMLRIRCKIEMNAHS